MKRFLAAVVLWLGLLAPALPISPLYQQLLLNSGCWNDAKIDINFAAGTSCGQAQLTVSRASVGYIDDLDGTWKSVPADILRRSNKGALIEESRTNSIRNNSMQ